MITSIKNDMTLNNNTKIRFVKIRFGPSRSIKHNEGVKLLKLKLNMTKLKRNYEGKYENVVCR